MMPASIADYRELAHRRLPPFLFEYIDGGSYAEVTLRRNVADLESVALRQRVLKNVSSLDTSTSLLGQRLSMPIILGPIGLAGMNARRGECEAIRAADRAGVPLCLSILSVSSLAEVVRAATAPSWFQLYMIRDRPFMIALLAEAERLGCPALMFTVDMPVPGCRYRDQRSDLAGAPGWAGHVRRFSQAMAHPGGRGMWGSVAVRTRWATSRRCFKASRGSRIFLPGCAGTSIRGSHGMTSPGYARIGSGRSS